MTAPAGVDRCHGCGGSGKRDVPDAVRMVGPGWLTKDKTVTCWDCRGAGVESAVEEGVMEIQDDTDCAKCEQRAQRLTCDDCGVSAMITDCGHMAQPRPIAGLGHEMLCDGCAEARALKS